MCVCLSVCLSTEYFNRDVFYGQCLGFQVRHVCVSVCLSVSTGEGKQCGDRRIARLVG